MADDLARAKAAVDRAKADVARAQDEQHRAESAHEIAHLSYARLEKVSQQKPGLVAQQEIDDAHSKDLVSEAQVAAAKSALVSANQQVDVNNAELSKINTMIEYTKVTAPFTGVITKRYADTGSMIQAGTASQTQAMPLVRLSENSLLRLILPVPESAVPGVHIGQQVEVRVPTLNRSFPGPGSPLFRQAAALHAHDGYRGRCAECFADSDPRHVRGGESYPGAEEQCAGGAR